MSLSPLKTPGFTTYDLSTQEQVQSALLSPETQASLENQASALAQQLVTMKFGTTPEEREGQILHFVYLQAQRDMLLELLGQCSAEFHRLSTTE